MDIYLAASHFLMTMKCLGREIDYVEAIAVAIRIEVELKVLILANQLGWVHRQAKSQATISHSHGESTTAVGHHLGMGFRSIRLRRSFQIGSRKITPQLDSPSGIGTGDVGSIIFYLVIIGCQQGISSEQLAVIEAQASLNLDIMLHEPLLFLLTHLTFA